MSQPNPDDLLIKIVNYKHRMGSGKASSDIDTRYRICFSDLYDCARNGIFPTNTDMLVKDFYLCRGRNGGFTYNIAQLHNKNYILDVFNGISGMKIASYDLTAGKKVL